MIRHIIFTLLLIVPISQAFAQWRCANTYNSNISDIFFADRLTGYACGVSAGIGNCSGTNSILRTIDGGETWIRMNTGSTAAMYRLHFVDAFTGWAVGNSSTVLKTTDGGQTWVTQTSGVGAGYNSIHFPTPQVGFVVGQNGIVRKSTNGGAFWTTIQSGSITLRDVWFVNQNLGFYVGNSGALFRTTNGGGSFQSVYSGSDFLKEVWFADEQIGYAMSSNKLLKTINGGNSWTSYDAEEGQIWLRMHWVNANTGYIFGDLNLILRTDDGGETWQQIPSDLNETVSCGFFLDEEHGYVGGDRGRIAFTDNGGNSWDNKVSGIGRQYGIAYKTPEIGLMVGTSGNIYRSKNSGLTHKRISSGTDKFHSSVKWLDDNIVLACGEAGSIIRSTDAGFTWQSIESGTTEFLTDLCAPDANHAYASGGNGTVIKTSDAGLNWEVQNVGSDEYLDGIHFLNSQFGMAVGGNKIFRTLDGGATWELKNTDVNVNTSFNDVWVASDSLAYAAGTFGKFYWTNNGGEAWEGIFPTSNTNAEIDEMEFINDTVGYFARLNSQSFTLNGGFQIGSQSTYCLANNGGVDAIEIVYQNEKTYGYCSGGISNVFHTLAPDSLSKTYLQDSIFCSGSRIFVGYLATGLLYNNEVIIAQLSDANGSFDNPQNIGSYTLVNPNISPSNIITCQLPGGLNGTGYRIRVVCESPMLTAPDNGYDIRIQSGITPVASLLANPPAACGGEPILLAASGTGLGANAQFSWTINGNPINTSSPMFVLDTLSVPANVEVQISSSLTCANPLTVSANTNLAISEAPTVNAGIDLTICQGDAISIGNASNENATWFPETGLDNAQSAEPEASPSETTTYILTTQNDVGCSSTDSVTVTVLAPPIASAGEDTSICQGLTISIGDEFNQNANWTPSTGLSDPQSAITDASPVSTTTYVLTVTNEGGCSTIDSVTVTVNTNPIAIAGADLDLCLSQTGILGDASNENPSWLPVDGLSNPFSPTPFSDATTTTEYVLTVSNENNCIDTDTVLVTVHPNPEQPVIELSGGELILAGNPQGMINWYLDGELLEDELNDTLLITATGSYIARIEDEFGCSELSEPFVVSTVTISAITSMKNIYTSNTSRGWLVSSLLNDELDYSVFDLRGSLLAAGKISNNDEIIGYPSDTQGIYLIHLKDSKGFSRTFKVVR